MKVIKPNRPIVKIVEKPEIKVGDEMIVNDKPTVITVVNEDGFTVEELMESLLPKEEEPDLNPNEVKVEFTLTKRQYGLWEKKGGVSWLKKKLVGQK